MITGRLLALQIDHAAQRLSERLRVLEGRLSAAESAWREYAEVAAALAHILRGYPLERLAS